MYHYAKDVELNERKKIPTISNEFKRFERVKPKIVHVVNDKSKDASAEEHIERKKKKQQSYCEKGVRSILSEITSC